MRKKLVSTLLALSVVLGATGTAACSSETKDDLKKTGSDIGSDAKSKASELSSDASSLSSSYNSDSSSSTGN